MADRIFNVYVKRSSRLATLARVALFFIILIGAVGFSRVWFGGAWVIDVMALILAFIGLMSLKPRVVDSVRMTPAEILAWAQKGCPNTWGRGEIDG